MYKYLEHVLANYFGSASEASEDDAITLLHQHLGNSPELSEGFLSELQMAFQDEEYSWVEALEEGDVLLFENESEARCYALKIFASFLAK